jgi:imidazoleglycerol-phosphate dehydratase/histidinol-phosphatase
MARKVLFVARDGTLIEEVGDGRVDRVDEIALTPGVIPALVRCHDAGYELVVVSNQPSLGSGDLATADFDRVNRFVLSLFESQGIRFSAVLICPHAAGAGCDCRKPAVGLVRDYIADPDLDRARSAVVGGRDSDLEFARNLGLPGFRLASPDGPSGLSWTEIAHRLVDRPRTARVNRRTRETDIEVGVDLDREAEPRIETGIGFFDHMLEQLGKHGGFALDVRCRGDLAVDEHHTVEDVALTLGEALRRALGEKRGIQRYGFTLPMDETTAEVALDLGGRPYLVFEADFPRERVGGLPTELVGHFFRSLSDAMAATLQIRVHGQNTHHMVEACFKGVARALRQAFQRVGDALPSTKGTL